MNALALILTLFPLTFAADGPIPPLPPVAPVAPEAPVPPQIDPAVAERLAALEARVAALESGPRPLAEVDADADADADAPPATGALTIGPDERRGDIVSYGGPIDVFGIVDGDAVSLGGDLRVHPGARITGNAVSMGGEVFVEEGGAVDGDTVSLGGGVHTVRGGHDDDDDDSSSAAATATGSLGHALATPLDWLQSVFERLSLLLAFAGAGVLIAGIWPKQVARIAEAMPGNLFWYSLAGGVLSLALSLAAGLFAITLVGIPLSALMLGLVAAAWLVGLVGFCSAAGVWVPWTHGRGAWAAFLVGAALLGAIGLMPYLGPLLLVLVGFPAVGAALLTRFGTRPAEV